MDGKHYVSDKVLNSLKTVAYNQDYFGINKYGKPLHASMKYDWLKMLREELADGLKYLECEAERKEVVIEMLEYAIENNNWFTVQSALHQLKQDGTGK
jgi:hypothetical protein